MDRSRARPASAGDRRAQFLPASRRARALHRHHRHQRQDHHRVSDRRHSARRGQDHRDDRNHRIPPGGTRFARRPTPRPNRWTSCASRRSWSSAAARYLTMEVSSHALALGAGLRIPVPHRRVHQSDARSSGFSRHHGRVRRGQAAAVSPEDAPAPQWAVLNADDPASESHACRPAREVARRSGTGFIGTALICARENIVSGFDGLALRCRVPGRSVQASRITVGRARQRLEYSGRAGRGLSYGLDLATIARGHSRRAARFRAASSGSTAGSPFWWWWITPTPTTRCATRSSRPRADARAA